jgi:hypothetical protein
MKKLDEADRRQAERASRGPSFLARWWSRGIQDGLIEGTHGMVKSVLIAVGTFIGWSDRRGAMHSLVQRRRGAKM